MQKSSTIKVLPEAVHGRLEPLDAVEVARELCAGKEAEVLRGVLPDVELEAGGAVSPGRQQQRRPDEVLVRLEVALVVLRGVGGAAEQADQGVAARPAASG